MNEEDLKKYRELKSVIASGNFDIKGSAIFKVALLVKWYDELELKIQGLIPKPAPKKVK